MDFRVNLNIFRGPLDLLLYLVRKNEVEIVDIPISTITDQYLEYLACPEQLDVSAVGDFLGMASLLIEIKSQQVLPRRDEVEEELEDPGRSWSAGFWSTSSIAMRPASWKSGAAPGSSTIRRVARRSAFAPTEPGRGADPGGRALGPGQRIRPDRSQERRRPALQHRLRRYADPRLHGQDPTPG